MTGIMPQFTLEGMLTALTSAGYEVSFTQDRDPAAYIASVSRLADGYSHDGIADSAAEALAAALPDSFEAYLAAMAPRPACACGHAGESHWEVAEPGSVSEVHGPRTGCSVLGCKCRRYGEYEAPDIEADVRTLSADMTDVFDRLDGLEEHGKTVRPLVWMLVDLLVKSDPGSELARQLRAEHEAAPAAAAASPN